MFGKTSTREMICSIFSKKYNILKTEKNYNSNISLPYMLLKLENQDFGILEVGIDRIGEMDKLSMLLKPIVSVITLIGLSHIEYMKSKENIFKEKISITNHMKKNSLLLLNNGSEYLCDYTNDNFDIIKYSKNEASNIIYFNNKIKFNIDIYNNSHEVTLNVIGDHNILNAICAIRIAEKFNIELEYIKLGLSSYNNFERRMQVINLDNDIVIIDDTYNSSYDSVKSGIETINKIKGDKIVVLGDILELGKYNEEVHSKIGKLFNDCSINKLYIFGKNSIYTYNEAKKYVDCVYFTDKEKLINSIKKELTNNKLIYFKASNSMKFNDIIKEII
ncbi:MAG: UDP-N-acetylmuramoyl-tripeptide--D-alanyl-D-alanine ligase [Clostridia bacterium]